MANFRGTATFAVLTLAFLLVGSVGSAAQTGDFPLGTYYSSPFTFTFEEGGAYRVKHASGAGVTGTYKISGDKIEFADQDGELMCQESSGKYTWKLDRDSLIFSAVDDACDGRKEALTSKPLVKKNRQEAH